MAQGATKRQIVENARKLQQLRIAAALVNLLFVLLRLVLRYASTSKKTFVLYVFSMVVAVMLQLQLEVMGRASYGKTGNLLSAGEDLLQSGTIEYICDILYLTWIIYILVAFVTDYAWILYLSIPGYACFKLGPLLLSALGMGGGTQMPSNQSAETSTSKRQGKMKAKSVVYGQR